jgi:hypothetical protein
MDYRNKINTNEIVLSRHFRELLEDPDQHLTGFYLTISDPPDITPSLPHELKDHKPLLWDEGLATEEYKDKVEYIYSKSYTFSSPIEPESKGWIPLATTRTDKGYEMYLDIKELPLDFSASYNVNKYSRWFLGYRNNLTGEMKPAAYGYNARDVIKIGVQNSINLDITHRCEIEILEIDERNKQVYQLETSNITAGSVDPLYYHLSELEDRYKNTETHSDTTNVGLLHKGKLKFNNI